ncbi:hypothetical protein M885DRAFT_615785 [Pelagophyceae sp. CCMP2097]|nr:hypothetical protein M885DRAFT_615785 [Pelagophyceae sp. CCMP2097]
MPGASPSGGGSTASDAVLVVEPCGCAALGAPPEALPLAADVLDVALGFLDGRGLLALLECGRGAAQQAAGAHRVYGRRVPKAAAHPWACVTARECANEARGAAAPGDGGPAAYRLARAVSGGVFVVELGSSVDRVGLSWWDTPRCIECAAQPPPKGRARRAFDDEAETADRVARALAVLGVPTVRGTSLLVVAPHFASRVSAARVAAALLSRGAGRVRVERGAVCAAAAALAERGGGDALAGLSAAAAAVVVVDVGAAGVSAVPVLLGRVPAHILEAPEHTATHAYTALRHAFGGNAATRRFAAALRPEDAHRAAELRRTLGYVRRVSTATTPVSQEELDYAAVPDMPAAVAAARFMCLEPLFEPSQQNESWPPLATLAARAASAAATRDDARVSTIVLCGGGTAVDGFDWRLQRDLRGAPADRPARPGRLVEAGHCWSSKVEILPAAAEARRHLSWRGAARLARGRCGGSLARWLDSAVLRGLVKRRQLGKAGGRTPPRFAADAHGDGSDDGSEDDAAWDRAVFDVSRRLLAHL